jgi:hypothetical protein
MGSPREHEPRRQQEEAPVRAIGAAAHGAKIEVAVPALYMFSGSPVGAPQKLHVRFEVASPGRIIIEWM